MDNPEKLTKQSTQVENKQNKSTTQYVLDTAIRQTYTHSINIITISGIIGDWKNWFTVAQNEEFDAVYKKEMENVGVKFTFEMPK